MWARPPVVEVVTSIALLSDSTTTRGEYLALATKRITGEWHFHGGKKKSGESMPEATRRESLHFFAWFQCPGFDSLHHFSGCSSTIFHLHQKLRRTLPVRKAFTETTYV